MNRLLALLVVVSLLFIPSNVIAETGVDFHDAKNKFYNDNGHDRVFPEELIVLENIFSVQAQRTIYFMLEDSQDNLPISDATNWSVRLVIRNSWNYTDFGVFGDGADLTAPTGDYTLIPGENYTLETKVQIPLPYIDFNDTYEVSVILAVKKSGYNPSESLSHYVQFEKTDLPAPPPPPPPPPEPEPEPEAFPHYIVVAFLSAIIVLAMITYFIIERRRDKKKGDEEKS